MLALFSALSVLAIPWAMSGDERSAFDSIITQFLVLPQNTTSTFVEWGAGGSTLRVLALAPHARVFSVDNSRAWLARVDKDVRAENYTARWHQRYVDLGPPGHTGFPLRMPSQAQREQYVGAFDDVLPAAHVVLVDARMRGRCAVQVAAKAGNGAVVMVHDFWDRLALYAPLLLFFDIHAFDPSGRALVPVRRAEQPRGYGRLVILRRKQFAYGARSRSVPPFGGREGRIAEMPAPGTAAAVSADFMGDLAR